MTTKRNTRYVTAIGEAIYPHLTIADTKFNSDGAFSVKLKIAEDSQVSEAKGEPVGTLLAFLDDEMEKSKAKAKKENPSKRIKAAEPPYVVDEEGTFIVNFKLKAKVNLKDGTTFEQKPALFDAKLKPFTEKSLYGGSRIKVAFEVIHYYTHIIGAGISLRLRAVQVIELKQGSNQSAEGFGFGEEEGYEAPESMDECFSENQTEEMDDEADY